MRSIFLSGYTLDTSHSSWYKVLSHVAAAKDITHQTLRQSEEKERSCMRACACACGCVCVCATCGMGSAFLSLAESSNKAMEGIA